MTRYIIFILYYHVSGRGGDVRSCRYYTIWYRYTSLTFNEVYIYIYM